VKSAAGMKWRSKSYTRCAKNAIRLGKMCRPKDDAEKCLREKRKGRVTVRGVPRRKGEGCSKKKYHNAVGTPAKGPEPA